jgi:serine/threonine protein kinase
MPVDAAPERFVESDVDVNLAKCDVYSLGCTLWSIWSQGVAPHEGTPVRDLQQAARSSDVEYMPLPSVEQEKSVVPAGLDALLAATTARDPEQRPSALDLLAQLRQLSGSGADTPTHGEGSSDMLSGSSALDGQYNPVDSRVAIRSLSGHTADRYQTHVSSNPAFHTRNAGAALLDTAVTMVDSGTPPPPSTDPEQSDDDGENEMAANMSEREAQLTRDVQRERTRADAAEARVRELEQLLQVAGSPYAQ